MNMRALIEIFFAGFAFGIFWHIDFWLFIGMLFFLSAHLSIDHNYFNKKK